MDAPTTTSADRGTSGANGGGGWFTPHKEPLATGDDQGPSDGRRLAAMRPVGRSAAPQGQPGQAVPDQAVSRHGAPEPAGQGSPVQERISPVDEAPMTLRETASVPHGTPSPRREVSGQHHRRRARTRPHFLESGLPSPSCRSPSGSSRYRPRSVFFRRHRPSYGSPSRSRPRSRTTSIGPRAHWVRLSAALSGVRTRARVPGAPSPPFSA